MMHYSYVETPLGRILVAGDPTGLRLISFQRGSQPQPPAPEWIEDSRPLRQAILQLEAYFTGRLRTFALNLAPQGTPFQQSVWQALQQIPYGQTMSYGALARRLGKPQASRAVGAANGRNPLPVVIPCHRVIGSTGKLTGYGGGLDLKAALLAFEQRNAPGLAEPTARLG
jgi:methylated-DNA-[protein]-cysteine S-methyltransferase